MSILEEVLKATTPEEKDDTDTDAAETKDDPDEGDPKPDPKPDPKKPVQKTYGAQFAEMYGPRKKA